LDDIAKDRGALERERDALRVKLMKQKELTADRLAEQRTLQRELRAETEKSATLRGQLKQAAEIEHVGRVKLTEEISKSAHLRTRLHQAIEAVDAMTKALTSPLKPSFKAREEARKIGSDLLNLDPCTRVHEQVSNSPPKVSSPGVSETASPGGPTRPDLSPEALMKIEQHFFEEAAHRPMTNKEEEELRVKYKLTGPFDRHGMVSVSEAAGVMDAVGQEIAEAVFDNAAEVASASIVGGPESPADDDDATVALGTERSCHCGAEGRVHVKGSLDDCVYAPDAPKPTTPGADGSDCTKIWFAPGGGCKLEKSGRHVFVDGPPAHCGSCKEEFVSVPREEVKPYLYWHTPDGGLAGTNKIDPDTRVWLAPRGDCDGSMDGNHTYQEPPHTRHGSPFCGLCGQLFEFANRPEDENVAYIVPAEARRLTGS
jgi:hypothetical protein